ncbi:MAG: hypothetical protein WAV09_02915 [Minisyncoccia bacterium]
MLVLCLFWFLKRRRAKVRWNRVTQERAFLEVSEPQMGHPVTQGVIGWQSRQEDLAEIDALLKRSEGADLQEFESAELSSSKDDDPWAGQMADEVVPHHYYRAPGIKVSE